MPAIPAEELHKRCEEFTKKTPGKKFSGRELADQLNALLEHPAQDGQEIGSKEVRNLTTVKPSSEPGEGLRKEKDGSEWRFFYQQAKDELTDPSPKPKQEADLSESPARLPDEAQPPKDEGPLFEEDSDLARTIFMLEPLVASHMRIARKDLLSSSVADAEAYQDRMGSVVWDRNEEWFKDQTKPLRCKLTGLEQQVSTLTANLQAKAEEANRLSQQLSAAQQGARTAGERATQAELAQRRAELALSKAGSAPTSAATSRSDDFSVAGETNSDESVSTVANVTVSKPANSKSNELIGWIITGVVVVACAAIAWITML